MQFKRYDTHLEATILKFTFDQVNKNRDLYTPLMRDGKHLNPVPFFGKLGSARVLTLGLNPSSTVFSGAPEYADPDETDMDAYCQWLWHYFDEDQLPHAWFSPWAKVLKDLGLEYGLHAAHIDLSPRPTLSVRTFKAAKQRELFLQMIRDDMVILDEVLGAAKKARCVLAAGSVTNQYYINQLIDAWHRKCGIRPCIEERYLGDGPSRFVVQKIMVGTRQPLTMFFCTSGPSFQGGRRLINTMRQHREKILTKLDRPSWVTDKGIIV